MEYLQALLISTNEKLQSEEVENEYDELEQVPPAPGRPEYQHEKMIKKKLCQRACANETKNRYSNLYPFDKNIYKFHNKDLYINGSWIDIKAGFRYIITMAPLHPNSGNDENTCPEFWEMCWESKARVIVMLCKVEVGFSGCAQYFPKSVSEEHMHGSIKVKCAEISSHDVCIERRFTLTKDGENHHIHHFLFPAWPNYGVPEGIKSISKFVELVHKRSTEINQVPFDTSTAPSLIVHCSGGIGRSGTFLASYVAYTNILELVHENSSKSQTTTTTTTTTKTTEKYVSTPVSLKEQVLKMRMQRHPWMVEGLHQYRFAYQIVLQLIDNLLHNL